MDHLTDIDILMHAYIHRTLVDDNSDTFIHRYLESEISNDFIKANRKREKPLPWNKLMDEAVMMLQKESKKSLDDIKRAMINLPFHDDMSKLLSTINKLDVNNQVHIVSDSNTFFIGSFLEGSKLQGSFASVITNPTFIEEETKLLRVRPYHKEHGCDLCPENLCKTLAVNEIIKKATEKDSLGREDVRIVYVGYVY